MTHLLNCFTVNIHKYWGLYGVQYIKETFQSNMKLRYILHSLSQ